MNELLEKISAKYKVKEEEKAANVKLLNQILKDMIKNLKNDELFAALYTEADPAGSYWDGLKVEHPNEYDINFKFYFPRLCHLYVERQFNGNLTVEVDCRELEKQNLCQYKKLPTLLDENGYLSWDKVNRWFERIVQFAVLDLQYHWTSYKIKQQKNGPAKTLRIYNENNSHVFVQVVLLFSLLLPTQQLSPNTALEVHTSKSLQNELGKIIETIFNTILQLGSDIAKEIDKLKGNLEETEAEQLQGTLDYAGAKLVSTVKDLLPTFKRIAKVAIDVFSCVRTAFQTLRSSIATFTSEIKECVGILLKLVKRFFGVVLKFALEAWVKYEAFLVKFMRCKNIYCRFRGISDSLKDAVAFVMVFLENGADVIFELINKFPACISDALYVFTKEVQLAIGDGGKCVANVGGGELRRSEICKSNIEVELKEIIDNLINITVFALLDIGQNILDLYSNFPTEAQIKMEETVEVIIEIVKDSAASLQTIWEDIQNVIGQIVYCVYLEGVVPVQDAVNEAKQQLGVCVEDVKGLLGQILKDLEEPLNEVLLKLWDFFFSCKNNICRIGLLTSLPSLIAKISPAFAKIAGNIVNGITELFGCAKQQFTDILATLIEAFEASKTCVLNIGD